MKKDFIGFKEITDQSDIEEIKKIKDLKPKDFKRLDIIETNYDELDSIIIWCRKNEKLILKNENFFKPFFNEITLKISRKHTFGYYVHFYIDNQYFYMSFYKDDKECTNINNMYSEINPLKLYKNILFKDYENSGSYIYWLGTYNKDFLESEFTDEDFNRTQITNYISLIVYINLFKESIIKQTRTHTHKTQSKKDKRKGKKPKVKLIKQNIIRLNTDHLPTPTEEEIKHYERHTFGWTVRGHWRTYQSGKKVWIKPQIRGDKNKVEGKIYEI